MRIFISVSAESRFASKEIVMFQPDLMKSDQNGTPGDRTNAVKALVVGTHVGTVIDGKVLYDLALWDGDSYYTAVPLRHVDSVYVMPLEPDLAKDVPQMSLSMVSGCVRNPREPFEWRR